MQNYFDQEILFTERELQALKTAQQKFSGSVATTTQQISVSVPLALDSMQIYCAGAVVYEITIDKPALLFGTLAWYWEDITKQHTALSQIRYFSLILGIRESGKYLLRIYARGKQSDVDALKQGQSVSLTNELTVRATDNFTLEQIS